MNFAQSRMGVSEKKRFRFSKKGSDFLAKNGRILGNIWPFETGISPIVFIRRELSIGEIPVSNGHLLPKIRSFFVQKSEPFFENLNLFFSETPIYCGELGSS